MKNKVLGLVLASFLAVPMMASANGSTNDGHVHHGNESHGKCHERNWQAKMEEREKKLLLLVNQYTPDQRNEWTKVINERKQLREKWLSPEFKNKREQWKKAKMEKYQALKKQYEEGKITKEELIKKMHDGRMKHWQAKQELKTAIKNKDDQKVKQILNQLLAQFKQQNAMMKAELNR